MDLGQQFGLSKIFFKEKNSQRIILQLGSWVANITYFSVKESDKLWCYAFVCS